MKDPYKKIWIHEEQYAFAYQLRFASNMLDDFSFRKEELQQAILKAALYNFLQDYINDHPDSGFFYWDPETEEVNFSTEDDALFEAVADAGYSNVWEDFDE